MELQYTFTEHEMRVLQNYISYVIEEDPYFVTCYDEETQETFGTVLGGSQPITILSGYIAKNVVTPLRVKLVWNEGGTQDGYWTLVDPSK